MAFDPDAYLAKKQKPGGFDPDAYLAKKTDTAPDWSTAFGSAPKAALATIGNTLQAAPGAISNFIASLPQDPLGYKIGRALKAAPGAVADELGGMGQYFRNLSPPEFRGSAPTMAGGEAEKHPWLAAAAGDTAPMRQAIATHPLGLAGDILGVAGTTAPGRYLIGKGADLATAPVRGAFRALDEMTPARRAEKQLLAAAQTTPGMTPDKIAQLLETNRAPTPGVPFAASHATQDPGITALEKVSRGTPGVPGASWTQFDTAQNSALFNALNTVANPATDEALVAARQARDVATKYHRQSALALADQGGMEGAHLPGAGEGPYLPNSRAGLFEQPIQKVVGEELAGPRGNLPSVKSTASYVLDPETTLTAGRTYEARKMLTDAMNAKVGVPLDEIASAAKSAGVSTRIIRDAMDSALDQASGGAWKQYLQAFKAGSADVDNITALNNIRDELQKKITGGSVMDGNGHPKLSRAFINQIIEKHGTNKYGSLLSPATEKALNDVRQTARLIEAPQANLRAGVTGGGGSDTQSRLAAAAHHLVSALGPVGRIGTSVMRGIGSVGAGAGDIELARLLQNPADAATVLRTAAARQAAQRVGSNGITPAMLAALLANTPSEQRPIGQ